MPASYLLVVTIEVRTDALKITLSRRPHLPGLCVLQGFIGKLSHFQPFCVK
jgi:hypothetical protein